MNPCDLEVRLCGQFATSVMKSTVYTMYKFSLEWKTKASRFRDQVNPAVNSLVRKQQKLNS